MTTSPEPSPPYRCNCGQEFDARMDRTTHMFKCPVMAERAAMVRAGLAPSTPKSPTAPATTPAANGEQTT